MNKHLLTFIFLVSITACTKTDPTPASDLVGNWRLVGYVRNALTSSAPVSVPSDKTVLVTFASDGTFNETYSNTRPVEYAFLGCGPGSYELTDKQIRIQAVCMSSLSGRVFDLVAVDSKRLSISTGAGSLGYYNFERQ
ncbi:hypothetical protein J2I47_10890 [Fibrella sp. HMF5335]|uniref:Lipocalin-like domain-containing protein n=1 Tax=Fibrella rubiginis TaxID=2817060 RepID=A0A939GEV4_9BACT|nr:hypothetical protein [Fibrella rubiginis]MBO0937051.1 hypothetical protein [Fibrella rubiginis]